MKRTKQQRSLSASNAAHLRLENRFRRENNCGKWNYHGMIRIQQQRAGRMLTRAEKKYWFNELQKGGWFDD